MALTILQLISLPLIAPSTSLARVKFLADSFIYIVSKVSIYSLVRKFYRLLTSPVQMGTTGSSARKSMNTSLPELVSHVRAYTCVPFAVGFGVYNCQHFEVVADAGADAVVVGSRIMTVIGDAGSDISNITKVLR